MASNFGHLNRDLFGSNLYIKGKRVLDEKRNLKVNEVSGKTKVSTKLLKFSGVVSEDNCPKTTIDFASYELISPNNLVKVSPDYDLMVESRKYDDNAPIVGVSTAQPTKNDDKYTINVCTEGVFSVEIEGNVSVQRGDLLSPSTIENGTAAPGNVAVFGIALQSLEATPPAVSWSGYGGDSDFDEYSITFPEITNVSSLCFKGPGEVHSHDDPLTFTISLWNGSSWIIVYTGTVGSDEDIILSSLGKIEFPNIPSVTQIRLSSNPFQNQSYHDMGDEIIKFGCATVKGVFYKGGFSVL